MKNILILVSLVIFINSCSSYSTNKELNTQSENEDLSEKRKKMTALIGEHKLKSISGAMGANTMIDISCEDGKWSGFESSITEGQRQGYETQVSKKDLTILNTLKIIIDKSLSLSISVDGKIKFKLPYKDNEMYFNIKNIYNEYTCGLPANANQKTIIMDQTLFLFAQDNLKKGEFNMIVVNDLMKDSDMIVISFDTKNNQFNIHMGYSDIGEYVTYIF